MLCSDCLRDGTGLSSGTVSNGSSPPVGTLHGRPELTPHSLASERTGAARALSPQSRPLAPQGAAPHACPAAGGLPTPTSPHPARPSS